MRSDISIYNYMKTRMIQNTIGQSNSAIASYVYDCWKYLGDTNAKYARYFPQRRRLRQC